MVDIQWIYSLGICMYMYIAAFQFKWNNTRHLYQELMYQDLFVNPITMF